MADQKNLNELLKWSIENQNIGGEDAPRAPPGEGPKVSQAALDQLFGGPSDADLMSLSMAAVLNPEVDLENKLIAFDNFEQLIERLDNANNLSNLGLWQPLLDCLANEEQDIRRMSAWCIGTAVQNNQSAQERLLAVGGLPKLVDLATNEENNEATRRKAVYALSSAVRNYQPAMDVVSEELGKKGGLSHKVDAESMDAVDEVMNDLKAKAQAKKD